MPFRAVLPRLVLLLLLAAAAIWLAAHRAALQPTALADRLAGFGLWAPALFVLVYAMGAVLLFPAALLSIAGGAVFGPVWGAVLDLVGATLGAAAAFLVARYLAADWVRRRIDGRLGRLVAGVEADGWRFVATVRLVPIVPYALLNYALGLTRIGFWPYIAASALSTIPGSVAYTWLGYAGRATVDGDATGLRYGLLGLGVLALAAFIPRMVRRLRAA
ncbi:MAG: TVP38/TMEM64 family protein [Rhodospirillales bacterium]|nr:TVP38/TMEM64 family protein [Rhodospirillales bacterium]